MVKYKNYVAGWLDSSIHDFLLSFPAAFPSMQFALITCLDSNPDPAELLATSPELEPIRSSARLLGQGLLLPTSVLLRAESSSQLMFGFDEICFFPDDRVTPKPIAAGLVGPNRINQERIDALGRWMECNSCSLALGDGDGMNFIVKAQGLLKYFVGQSMKQSEPSSVS